ncbi:MAG: aminotransferase class III-fold pyridoxal phosphate-dependent enzyme, partial [Ilumatobacteraceae bacterium]
GTGGAQEMFGVRADITTFGKVIGGGLPIGCVGGRRDIMETLSPLGPVFHAGTLAGNPLATAAGRAALGELTPDVYSLLRVRAERLSAVLTDACAAAGLPAVFPVVGTLVGMYFGAALGEGVAPTNFAEAKTTDEAIYRDFFHAMLAEGVALAPGAYEALFVGLGHTDEVLDAIGAAAGRAAAVAASAAAARATS